MCSGDLKRHKRFVHSEQSQLPCGHCHRKYASEGTLIRHMKTAHSDVLLQTLKQRTQQQVMILCLCVCVCVCVCVRALLPACVCACVHMGAHVFIFIRRW